MTDFLLDQEWLVIALIFFGTIFFIAWKRWRDQKWIEKRFGRRPAIALSFGVNYFGRATEPGAPHRSSGFLLLLPDCLFFRSRTAKVEVEISGSSINRVYHDTSHKGVALHRSVIKVDFVTDQGQKDTAAFAVPYPPQWIQAIENTVLQNLPK